MGLFKRKLAIEKRAEEKETENKSFEEEYENRNIFFDIVGFLCILFAGILLLSYLSMNMEDLNSGKDITNLLGIFGAYISSYSFLAFGFSSYIIPAFFIYAGINIILKNSADKVLISALSSSVLMILFSVLLNIFLGDLDFYNKGGMMGEFIGGSLVSIFGKTGAFMIVISALLITAIVFTKVSIMDLVNYFRNMIKNVDLEKIKDIEKKVVNGIKDLEMKNTKTKENNNIENNNDGKFYTKDYLPLFYTKEVSELEFKTTPFIEKKDLNYYGFDEKKYREDLSKKSSIMNDFFNKNDSENREIDNIVSNLKNSHFTGINVNIMETKEEDLGLTLAETVFGRERVHNSSYNTPVYESSMEKEDNFYRDYYNDFINKKKNEDVEEYIGELDYNINYLRKSDFKRAAYEDSVDNYAKYNVGEKYIKYKYPEEESFEIERIAEAKEDEKEEDNQYIINESYELNKNNKLYEDEKIIEENKKEEYVSAYNKAPEINKKKREAFEFGMGYASKREYNRADHIPNYNHYTDSKIDEFDLDEEELYHANDEDIEDTRINYETDNYIIDDDMYSEYLNNLQEHNKLENIANIHRNAERYESEIIKESEEVKNIEPAEKSEEVKEIEEVKDIEETKKTEEINNSAEEASGFINMESQKTVDTLQKPKKVIIGTKSIKNMDTERIQSNFDTKYVDKHYKHPPFDLLNRSIPVNDGAMMESIKQTAMQLEHTLLDFYIEAKVTGVSRGPVITRYELEIASGIRVSKISNLTDNIALALASESVRIIAPIPGRSVIGIEIPNKVRNAVFLRDVLESTDFRQSKLDIPFVLGKGIYGNNVVSDMSEAPHLLVAGTTGSGKSVCLSTIILSLLYKFRPDELKFIFVDKKRVELSIYNGIPHLMSPVVSDEKKATIVLRYIVDIMEKRYERMERFFVRNVKTYNEKVRQLLKEGETEFNGEPLELFPYIVLVIDELHNLMVVASKEVEDLISRLAGMSRAVGIHLIIATQRPSADVVTGVIKANLPTRIAFQVPNKTNSRIIIDMSGAEQLLGKGDALFCASGSQMPDRVQGAFVSDNEVKKVVDYLSGQMSPMFDESLIAALEGSDADDKNTDEEDILDEELWEDAVQLVARTGKASASFLQRRLKIGYNRAARIVEIMERQGIVGPENGSKPREVLITLDE